MSSNKKQSKVELSHHSQSDDGEQAIAGDVQELLDGYLGVPADIQPLIAEYLNIKEQRRRKRQAQKKKSQ